MKLYSSTSNNLGNAESCTPLTRFNHIGGVIQKREDVTSRPLDAARFMNIRLTLRFPIHVFLLHWEALHWQPTQRCYMILKCRQQESFVSSPVGTFIEPNVLWQLFDEIYIENI